MTIYDTLDEQRQYLGALDRATAMRMQAVYAKVLDDAQRDHRAFQARVTQWKFDHPSADPRGSSPSRHWVFQEERYQYLIAQLQRNLAYYAKTSANSIEDAQRAAMHRAQDDNLTLIRQSVAGGEEAQGMLSLAVLPDDAINAVAGMVSTGSPLRQLLADRSRDFGQLAADHLVTGVALGYPVTRISDQFDTDLHTLHWQNLRLARTEMMRAYREAQRVNMLQNSDIIAGWRWSSALDKRSCPMCLGEHGKVFPLQHVSPGQVPPDTAQHKGLSDTFATAPTETAKVG